MGIYIEGVNLPELSDYSKRNNTPDVYNLHGAIVVYPDGKVELKSYIGAFEGTYDVISVPPHGRCIDADALTISTAVPLDGKPYQYVHIDNIKGAPTIIPVKLPKEENMTDFEKLRVLFPLMNRIIHRWKECGDNQPTSRDKVFCCSACGKGRLFEWQLTPFCPHCGLKLSKPGSLKEEK